MIGRSHGSGSAVPSLSHAEAEALISARLDGPLTQMQEAALAGHLGSCHSCSTFAARMGAMETGFRSLPHLPASPTVSRQVRERIAQPASLADRLGRLFGGRVGFAPMAATAALIAVVIAGYALFQGDDNGGRLGPTVAAGTQISDNATSTAEQNTQVDSSATVQGYVVPTSEPTLPTNVRADTPTITPVPTDTAVPTDTVVPTSAPTETATATIEPTATVEPSATTAPTQAPTATRTPTTEPAATDTATVEATATSEPTATKTATSEPTATKTATAEPTATNTPEPTSTNTPEPTATDTPTEEPTATETPKPTKTPKPTRTPTPEETATEETSGPPTIGPSDDQTPEQTEPSPTEEPTETETPTATIEDTTLIVPVETPDQGNGGEDETPTEEAIGGPTSEANGTDTSNTAAPLDDTSRITGISAAGAPTGELRNNSQHTLMVLSSDTSGGNLLIASMDDGSIVMDLGAGSDPIWSPLGLVLLYQSYASGAPAAAIYDSETGETRAISDPGQDGAVQDIPAGWSDTSAYYLRETGDDKSTVILFAYDVNSDESREVWRSEGVSLSGGRPVATGSAFLIATEQSWLLVGVDGSENNLGTNDYGLSGEGVLSPGGSLIAYPSGDQIVIASVDSPGIPSGLIPYVEGSGSGFTWSPDGEYLAVSDGYSIQVYQETGDFVGAATSDNGVTIAAPQWFDDGIYYVETSPTPSLRRLRLSKVPGLAG